MKSIHTLAFLLLMFMLSIASFAATNSKEITLYDITKIGNAELQPGTYKVTWNGNGPDVQVDFLKNKQVVASGAAKLENARRETDSVQTRTGDGGSSILEEIDFKNTQLVFAGAADEHSGN